MRLLSLLDRSTLPLLAVNETKDITLTFAPSETVPPGPDPYNLVLRVASVDGAVTLDVPVVVYVDATGKGNLLVQAYDLYSGSGVSRPAGSLGPKITLKKVDGTPIPDVVSQADADWSDVLVRDLPVGLWDYRVSADRHEAVSGRVEIKPGVTSTLETLLRNTLVTVEWEVVPTTLQDQYQVVLTADYETQVPAPVVTVTPTSVALPYLNAGETYTGEFLVENQGLVRADNVTLVVPDGGTSYRFEFLSQPPDSLEPNQFVRLPYRVTKLESSSKASSGSTSQGKKLSAASDVCTACEVNGGAVNYDVVCPNGTKFTGCGPFAFGSCYAVPCPPGGGSGEGIPVSFSFPDGGAGWAGAPVAQGGSTDRRCDMNNPPGGPSGGDCFVRILEASQGNNYNPLGKQIILHAQGSGVITWSCVNKENTNKIASGSGSVFTPQIKDPGVYEVVALCKSTDGTSECTDHVTVVVFRAEIQSIRFTSDHKKICKAILASGNENQTVITCREYDYNNPHWIKGRDPGEQITTITHDMGKKIGIELVVDFEPQEIGFSIRGNGGIVAFSDFTITKNGETFVCSGESDNQLPNEINILDLHIKWYVEIVDRVPMEITNHVVYTTFSMPSGELSIKNYFEGGILYQWVLADIFVKKAISLAQELNINRETDYSTFLKKLWRNRTQGNDHYWGRGSTFDNINEIMKEGKGQCQAITRAMRALCQMIGVPGEFTMSAVWGKPLSNQDDENLMEIITSLLDIDGYLRPNNPSVTDPKLYDPKAHGLENGERKWFLQQHDIMSFRQNITRWNDAEVGSDKNEYEAFLEWSWTKPPQGR